jgi:transposase
MSSQHRGHLAAADLEPDFKTIADFRADNGKAFRAVFRQFVVLLIRS